MCWLVEINLFLETLIFHMEKGQVADQMNEADDRLRSDTYFMKSNKFELKSIHILCQKERS